MICPKCNSQILEGTPFCSQCGSPLKDSNSVRNNANAIVVAKHRKRKTVGIIIVAVLGVALLIGGIAIMLTKNNSNDNTNGDVPFAEEIKVGDYITFGQYEQDNNLSNGKEDIEWIVLAKDGNRVLVISEYALDCKQYHNAWEAVTWENCTLRGWLNNEFYNEAFSSSEQTRIPTVIVPADENPDYDTDPGNDTYDKVFLLSIGEASKYFAGDSDRQCKYTAYAVANGTWEEDDGICFWRLRSPGRNQKNAACVSTKGRVVTDSYDVNYEYDAVRPAMWIELK